MSPVFGGEGLGRPVLFRSGVRNLDQLSSTPEYDNDLHKVQTEKDQSQQSINSFRKLPEGVRERLSRGDQGERSLSMPVLSNEKMKPLLSRKERVKRVKPEPKLVSNRGHAMEYSSSEDGEIQARERIKPRLGGGVFNRNPPERNRRQKLSEIPFSDSSDEIKALREENRKLKEYQRMQEERVSSSDTVQDRDSNPRPSVVSSPGSPDHIREVVARTMEAQLSVVMEQQQLLLEAKLSAMME